jgi:hypothetical protein
MMLEELHRRWRITIELMAVEEQLERELKALERLGICKITGPELEREAWRRNPYPKSHPTATDN